MRRRKIVFLCVAGFLLVAAFIPWMNDVYTVVYEPDKAKYYKSHVTHIGMLHVVIDGILNRSDVGWQIPPITETQLLKDSGELTHDERIDILSDECVELFIHTPYSVCDYTLFSERGCIYYYDSNDQYLYCKAMYDETHLNRQECKMLHDIHLEYWEGIVYVESRLFQNLNDFEEFYCRGSTECTLDVTAQLQGDDILVSWNDCGEVIRRYWVYVVENGIRGGPHSGYSGGTSYTYAWGKEGHTYSFDVKAQYHDADYTDYFRSNPVTMPVPDRTIPTISTSDNLTLNTASGDGAAANYAAAAHDSKGGTVPVACSPPTEADLPWVGSQ